MEAEKIAQAVFDELYEKDPKNEYENNNMEKPLEKTLEKPERRYLRVSKKRRFN
jgi:S-adenosylmethionine/arginine decarboxylase-like enzyme